MTEEELTQAAIQHKGTYNNWTGALQHVAVWSRQDISHAVMRLSGYNAAPSLPCWKALHQVMCYLYHKPHIPIMCPHRKVKETQIKAHHAKGEAEITKIKNILEYTGMKAYSDSDLAKDIATR